MWFSTEDGLNKYDGNSFTIYRYKPADSSSIGANYIQDTFEDSEQQLWLPTWGGELILYNRDKDNFTIL